jgi:selenide,water dikinase
MNASPAQAGQRLTSFARGAGCGCKLPAADLHALLADLPVRPDDRVLVGFDSADDAAVVTIAPGLGLVQTVDFFTPIVDDPTGFGAIAAANALSDVYAMGGQPISALSLVGFPLQQLGGRVLRSIMQGAIDTLEEAGVPLVGGHSIDDPEPKFGLAVTGTVDPERVLRNGGARVGDRVVLTKPLGTGVIAAEAQRGHADPRLLAAAVQVMRRLNAAASREALAADAHAATDVTGFGLLGHLHGMARESAVAIVVQADAVPALAGVQQLLAAEAGISGGTRRNAAWAESFARFDGGVPDWRRWLLNDATTSGGLAVAVPDGREAEVTGAVIGRVVDGPAGTIHVQ